MVIKNPTTSARCIFSCTRHNFSRDAGLLSQVSSVLEHDEPRCYHETAAAFMMSVPKGEELAKKFKFEISCSLVRHKHPFPPICVERNKAWVRFRKNQPQNPSPCLCPPPTSGGHAVRVLPLPKRCPERPFLTLLLESCASVLCALDVLPQEPRHRCEAFRRVASHASRW